MPPLRFDRDTIVLGKLAADSLASPVEIELQAESAGKRQTMRWSVKPEQPLEDHAYLAKLVDKAAVDGGVKLPTVGSAGLKELRRIASIEAHGYSRLGQQALATGELDAAEQLARVASQLDPMNTEAATIQRAVASPRLEARPARAGARRQPSDASSGADAEGADGAWSIRSKSKNAFTLTSSARKPATPSIGLAA